MGNTGHVTIEKTSKRYKLQQLLSALAIIVGIFWIVGVKANAELIGEEPDFTKPAILIGVAIIVWIVTKIQIWWNHG